MIYSDLNCWGSGSWTYEITLWRLLLQLYFVAVFALVGVQAGWWDNTEESGHNGAALRKNGNCFQIMTQRHPDTIPESVETHLRYRKESNNSLSEYLQRFTLMFCLSLWLLTFPSLQILRPNFILEKTETNGNICSYGTSESKRPGQREAKESVRTKGNTGLGKQHSWKFLPQFLYWICTSTSPLMQNIRQFKLSFEVTMVPITGWNFLIPLSSSS